MQVVDRHFENLFPIVMSNCGSPPGNHKISIIFTNTRNELENLKVSECSIMFIRIGKTVAGHQYHLDGEVFNLMLYTDVTERVDTRI